MKAFASTFVWPDKRVYKEAAVCGYYINIGQILEQYEIGTKPDRNTSTSVYLQMLICCSENS